MTITVRIAQIQPEILGITGDAGNVRAIRKRLEAAGATVEYVPVGTGEDLPTDADIIVVGNGPLSAMRRVHDDLQRHGDALRRFVADGGSLLAVGGGAELLSRGVTTLDGERIEGLGVFDVDVARTRNRRVGYIVMETAVGTVVGFEDHASEWTLGSPDLAYGRTQFGNGAYDHPAGGRGEMVRTGEAIATYVQGPILPLNPDLTRDIIRGVLRRRGAELDLGTGVAKLDEYADGARRAIRSLVQSKTFSTIQL